MQAAISARLQAHEGSHWKPERADTQGLSAAGTPSPIALNVYDDLAAVEQDWRAFERHADCTVFQTFEWLSAWQRHIGARNNVRPAIAVGRDSLGILFMLPLSTRPAGFARELTWLGTELCDYNAPLLDSRFSGSVDMEEFKRLWHAIVLNLQGNPRLRFDLIRLEKMPATVGAQRNPLLSLGVTLNPSGAYATPLGADWETFYASKRSTSTRQRDRSKRKRLAGLGDIKLVTADSTSATLQTLAILMEQKAQSFARMGVSNLFRRPGHVEFYRAIATDPRTRAFVHVSRLDIGSQPAAANIGLMFRNTYYHLQASHADGDIARFGPGAVHLHELMRYAIEYGFNAYDFTIGDERYKRDWCDEAVNLYDHISVATWRGAAAGARAMATQRLKRSIKQSPWLWDLFSRARALIGSLAPPAVK